MANNGIVLLVEDNLKILDINRRMLEKEGINVLTAATLMEARERVKLISPDVVVLDIMLPDGSGLDFLAELKEKYETPEKPVCALFLTAKAERADIMTGLSIGGNDYITKPYDIDEFRMRVLGFLRLIESARMQRQENENKLSLSAILSKKELAVALLAAQGLYNKEIAGKVFLSESRVKTCLSGIYRKLGITEQSNKREILKKMIP
ncbi:MAG: response regulator [Treponema sp.]|nr:response regulator [Treponema sp.]MCL2237581.1 response regulator [Treponema sp.]